MFIAVLSGFAPAAVAPSLHRRMPRASGWIFALLPAGFFGWFALKSVAVTEGPLKDAAVWVPSLNVVFSFYLDGLSLLFSLLITGIGAFILAYSSEYLKGHKQRGIPAGRAGRGAMNILLLNILLALAWVALTGQFTGANFLAGFAVGFFVLWLSQPTKATAAYVKKIVQIVDFILYFLWELVKANLRVTYEVLARSSHAAGRHRHAPGPRNRHRDPNPHIPHHADARNAQPRRFRGPEDTLHPRHVHLGHGKDAEDDQRRVRAESFGIAAAYAVASERTAYLDAAVILALVAFLGTVAFAYCLSRRRP